MSDNDKKDFLFKVLVIGDCNTGKTSIIKRYVHGIFTNNYKSTIGVDFALKVLHLDNNVTVRLQIWDIAGQERFGNMTRIYYKDAIGAFLVFDVTRPNTFDNITKWKKDIDSKIQLNGSKPIPIVLLGNKIDLINDKLGWGKSAQFMDKFCQENGFIAWFETSAKDNSNIETATNALVENINNTMDIYSDTYDSTTIKLDDKSKKKDTDCLCNN